MTSCALDSRLSYRALGVLAALRAGAPVDAAALSQGDAREGRDAIRSALRELEHAGYIRRARVQDERGRWGVRAALTTPTPGPENPSPDGGNALVTPKTENQAPVVARNANPQVAPKTDFQAPENQGPVDTPRPYQAGNGANPQVTPETGKPKSENQALKERTPYGGSQETQPDTKAATTSTRASQRGDDQPAPGPGITGPRAVDAKQLIQRTIGPEYPSAVRTALAIEAAALLGQYDEATVAEALETWKTKTGIGPRILPSLVADLVKHRNANERERVRPPGRALSGMGAKAQAWADLGAAVQAEIDAGNGLRLIEGGRSV